MALALLLVADAKFGGVFTTLQELKISESWSFVAIVPTLAVIYALGLIITTGSAWIAQHWEDESQAKKEDVLALITAAKNELLNQKYGEEAFD